MAVKSGKAVLAEVLVIVFGVLIALFAENEWSELQARRLGDDYILRLASELEVNQSVAETDAGWRRQTCEAAESLLAEFRASERAADDLSLLHLAVASMVHVTYRFRRSTFDELVETGSLALIGEADLREQVVETYAFMESHKTWRPSIESPFRTAVIGTLPAEFIRRVVAECIFDEGRISSNLTNVRNCDVEPSEESAATTLNRLLGRPGITEDLSVRAWTMCNYDNAALVTQFEDLAFSLAPQTH